MYSTVFKDGTGLEKDFYDNGQLYYEIKTQNGYFTDTLKLYTPQGKLMEKLLNKKDSLIYSEEGKEASTNARINKHAKSTIDNRSEKREKSH